VVDLQLFFAQRPGWTLHGRLRREIIRAVAARQVEVPVLVVEISAGLAERGRADELGALAARIEEHECRAGSRS